MKMLYARVVIKAALNTQRKSISTIVRKEPETSYGLIHHFLTVKTNVGKFSSLTHYARSLTEIPSKLVI